MSKKEKKKVVESEPEKESSRIKTTVGDYGERLPVGILKDGILHKDISIKRWNTKGERELGAKVASDASIAEYVSVIVANMCTHLGPHNMDELDDGEKSLIVSTMYMADVFYAYTLIRIKAMGPRLRTMIKCPRPGCSVEFPYVGDLNTTDVVAVENIDDILWTYNLEEPIEIRKKTVTKFQMAYPKWTIMQEQRGNTNEGEVKAHTILGAVVGLEDEETPVILTINEIDELSKIDYEGILEGINENYLGPKMAIEGECTKEVCTRFKRGGEKFVFPIDWSYKNFFGSSSR